LLFAGAPWIAGKFKASGETVYLVSEKLEEAEAAATRLTSGTSLPAKSVAPANAHANVKSMISCFFSVIVMLWFRPHICSWYRMTMPKLPLSTDIHRMPVLLKLRLPLSTDIGNAKPSTWGYRAPKPVTLARLAPKMRILLSSTPTSPLVFDRTQNNQAFHVDTAAGGGRSSASRRRMSANTANSLLVGY
jgi:hypothetical protein